MSAMKQSPYVCPQCGPIVISDAHHHIVCERDVARLENKRLRAALARLVELQGEFGYVGDGDDDACGAWQAAREALGGEHA